ncbi:MULTISPECIES: WD40/YVTN/BNR-like repeat-containing protein [unclassified Burkholderia]|uniref:WD40/YVTN/BNR-like repeat-containing protein n=1 Tax=unclassified Burkholderia TaxID=2613784 RepID=UPI002AB2ED9C|nr:MULTISPECIES: YCF48-related protein [unclassified Burkholderia]
MAVAEVPPGMRPAVTTPLALRALMLAVAPAGASRMVAVGERGIVLVSDDAGRQWRQAKVPVSVTLTSVQFVDARQGWAAGHSGVVLHTGDGGNTWTRQLDGVSVAHLALEEAEAMVTSQASMPETGQSKGVGSVGRSDSAVFPKPSSQVALQNARRLVSEGADKPFLSLSFSDAQHGTAVGAYGIAVHTDDGGRTWQSWTARIGNQRALHLYAIRQRGNSIWVAGEQGFVAHSADYGHRFRADLTPYKGSFFSVGIGQDDVVVLGGLRGQAVRTEDGGATFIAFKPGGEAAITDIVYTSGGTWVLAAQNGQVLASRNATGTFQPLISRPKFPLNGIALTQSGAVLGAGFTGVLSVAHLQHDADMQIAPTTQGKTEMAGGRP